MFALVYLAHQKKGEQLDQEQIIQFLLSFCGIKVNQIDYSYNKDLFDSLQNKKWVKQFKTKKRKNIILSEEVLFGFSDDLPPYILERNYDSNTFELKFSKGGLNKEKVGRDFPGRVIIPIRDENCNLVGLSGRLATSDEYLIKKYMKYKHNAGWNKNLVLYNYHRALPYIKETKSVVLVEGFFDVMRLWSYGIKNVVSPMGINLSKAQSRLLLPYVNNLYLMFDGDKAGGEAIERIGEMYKRFYNIYVVGLPEGKDPDDLTKEEAKTLLLGAKKFRKGNFVYGTKEGTEE